MIKISGKVNKPNTYNGNFFRLNKVSFGLVL